VLDGCPTFLWILLRTRLRRDSFWPLLLTQD
jgi:hypothetical protein